MFGGGDIQIMSLPRTPQSCLVPRPNLWVLLVCFSFIFLGGKCLGWMVSGTLSFFGNSLEYLLNVHSVLSPLLDIEGMGNLRWCFFWSPGLETRGGQSYSLPLTSKWMYLGGDPGVSIKNIMETSTFIDVKKLVHPFIYSFVQQFFLMSTTCR